MRKVTPMELIDELEAAVRYRQKKVTEFKSALERDPSSTLESSGEGMKAAIEAKVFGQVLEALDAEPNGEKHVTVEQLIALTTERVLRRSRYPQHSTSPSSNLMHQYETSAWVQVLEMAGVQI